MKAGLLLALVLSAWNRPPELAVEAKAPDPSAEALLELALEQLGAPYVYGGVGRHGYDCSSFVCYVYAQQGYPLPRVSRQQAQVGSPVPLDAILPGDLLFFAESGAAISHVGIYLGDGAMVHASSGRGEVVVADLSQRWFETRLVAARRILDAPPESLRLAARKLETTEHRGGASIFLRRRRIPDPGSKLGLARLDGTGVGLRVFGVGGVGPAALHLVPELVFAHRPWALFVTLGLPVRLEPGAEPSIGETADPWRVVARAFRQVRLGLPGADLEVALERSGRYRVGRGELMADLVPAATGPGLPGISVEDTPLTGFVGFRTDTFGVEAMIDDALDPQLIGVGAELRPTGWWSVDVAAGGLLDLDPVAEGRQILGGLALGTELAYEDRGRGRVGMRLEAQKLLGAYDGDLSGELALSTRLELPGDARVGLDLHGGPVGAGGVYDPLSTVLLVHPEVGRRALERSDRARWRAGGQLMFARRGLGLRVGLDKGLGRAGLAYDDRLLVSFDLGQWALDRGRVLEASIGYEARRVFADRDRADVVLGSARLRLARWAALEALVAVGQDVHVGAGLSVAWVP